MDFDIRRNFHDNDHDFLLNAAPISIGVMFQESRGNNLLFFLLQFMNLLLSKEGLSRNYSECTSESR